MRRVFGLFVVLGQMFLSAVGQTCEVDQDQYATRQKTIDRLDVEDVLEAKVIRAKIVQDWRSSSAQTLAELYLKLPKTAPTFRYACLLLAAHHHKINIDEKIDAVKALENLLASINAPLDGPALNHSYLSFHSELLDKEHLHHVIGLLEHVVEFEIKSINLLKSNVEELPLTLLQLSNLEILLCYRDVKADKIASSAKCEIAYYKSAL